MAKGKENDAEEVNANDHNVELLLNVRRKLYDEIEATRNKIAGIDIAIEILRHEDLLERQRKL